MLKACNIIKSFNGNGSRTDVLKGVNVLIEEGEFVSITGRSGSGKTTLLNVLSTLVRPDSGELRYRDRSLVEMGEKELGGLRQSDFAVIFQFHHLLPYLNVVENTLLPFMNSMKPISRAVRSRAMECLERVGLQDKAHRLPANLSGGERQRVAIARALVKSSTVLFADEPTGSLDKRTGGQIMDLLSGLHRDGISVIMVTHDPDYARLADRIIEIEDGRVVGDVAARAAA